MQKGRSVLRWVLVCLVCTLRWSLAAAPANDNFSNRTEVLGTRALVVANISGATVEPDEPEMQPVNVPWQGTRQSIWWTWTAAANGTLTVDSSASVLREKVIAAFRGIDVATLTNLATAIYDDRLMINVAAGENYHIAALTDAIREGDLRLQFQFDGSPLHDNFSDRALLSGKRFTFSGTLQGATDDFGGGLAQDIWAEWTAPGSGRLRIRETPGIAALTYTGTALLELQSYLPQPFEVKAGDRIVFRVVGSSAIDGELFSGELDTTRVVVEPQPAIAGNTATLKLIPDLDYPPPTNVFMLDTNVTSAPWELTFRPSTDGRELRVRADYPEPRYEEFTATVQLRAPNDNFAEAITLPSTPATNHFDWLRAATREPGEPVHDSSGNGGSLWWRWQAPDDGYLYLESYSMGTAVYVGESLATLVRIAPLPNHFQLYPVQKGVTYSIALQNKDSFYTWRSIVTRFLAPIANDDFDFAESLPTDGAVIGELNGATKQAGENASGASIWYRWTAPSNGRVSFTVIYPLQVAAGFRRYDVNLKVFSGSSLGNLVSVAPDFTSGPFTKTVTTGDQFILQAARGSTRMVDDETPNFLLKTSFEPGPPNDMFEQRTKIASLPFSASFDSRFTSYETDELQFAPSSRLYTAWWEWTAPSNGVVSIAALAGYESTFPMTKPAALVRVFQGNALATLQPIAGQTNAYGEFLLSAVAGQNYKIAVFADWNTPVDFMISAALPNDDFADAALLDKQADVLHFSILGATFESGEDSTIQTSLGTYPTIGNLWWRYVAPEDGYIKNPWGVFGLLTGESRDTLARVPQDQSEFNEFDGPSFFSSLVEQGKSYYFDVRKVYAPPREPPAQLAHFISYDFGTFQIRGLTNQETVDAGVASTVTINAPNPVFDGTLIGNAALRLYPLDWWLAPPTVTMLTNYPFTASLTNLIPGNYLLYAIGVTTNGDTLQTPQIRFSVRNTNDLFAQRQQIMEGGSSSLAGATFEPGEAALFSSDVIGSIWFEWIAPATETVRFGAYNSSDNRRFGVFTGTSINSLQPVGQGNGSLILSVTAGMAYQIALLAPGSPSPVFAPPAAVSITRPPTNDLFANATLLNIGPGEDWLTPNLLLTSIEPGEPPAQSNLGTAWWKIMPTDPGTLTIGNALNGWELFRGDSLATLQKIDITGPTFSSASAELVAGTTYYLRRTSLNADENPGSITFNYKATPLNDDFAKATEINGDVRIEIPLRYASVESGEPESARGRPTGSVWWKWRPRISGSVDGWHSVFGTVELFAGASLSSLTRVNPIAEDRQFYTWSVDASMSYYIRAAVYDVAGFITGTIALAQPTVSPVPNDQFANRIALSGTDIRMSGTTAGSTVDPGEPPMDFIGSLWWSWKAPRDGFVRFWIPNGTYFRAWHGTKLAGLSAAAFGSTIFEVAKGEEIEISVHRFDAAPFEWRLEFIDPAPNLSVETATPLSTAGGTFEADFTRTFSAPADNENINPQWLYWKWTAPVGGRVTIANANSEPNGPAFWFFAENASTINAVAGRTYIIAGVGNKRSQFTLTFEPAQFEMELGFQNQNAPLLLRVHGTAESIVNLELSSDLVNWLPLGAFFLDSELLQSVTPAPDRPATFFRAVPVK